jgi:hypothetical protein
MQTDAPKSAAAHALFTKLVDYAGLFPPAELSMEQAVAEYATEGNGGYAWMLGRFIVQQSRVPELLDALGDKRFSLSVILNQGIDGLAQLERLRSGDPRIAVHAFEIILRPGQIDAFPSLDVPAFVEFPRDAEWEYVVPNMMEVLAHRDLGAKIRCGGLDAKAFPSPAEVAVFIYWACKQNVPFKATAGLHHPIRHVDAASGFHMHGFLNLLAAAALARAGLTVDELSEVLECEDASRFHIDDRGLRFGNRHVSIAELEAMRREAFVAYGSCSFSEPVEDLRGLHLLP